MNRRRERTPNSEVVHVILKSADPDKPATVTYCGKRLARLVRCCVKSVEAASCTNCIKMQQSGR